MTSGSDSSAPRPSRGREHATSATATRRESSGVVTATPGARGAPAPAAAPANPATPSIETTGADVATHSITDDGRHPHDLPACLDLVPRDHHSLTRGIGEHGTGLPVRRAHGETSRDAGPTRVQETTPDSRRPGTAHREDEQAVPPRLDQRGARGSRYVGDSIDGSRGSVGAHEAQPRRPPLSSFLAYVEAARRRRPLTRRPKIPLRPLMPATSATR